jgi:hypothetical protein
MNKCERCGSSKPTISLQMEEDSMYLCSNCYNDIMSEELEVELQQLAETFSLKDDQGISRTFYVDRRIHPNGIYLEAMENIEFGYKFAVHGELNADQGELLNNLIDKVRKGIGKQQVARKAFPSGQEYHSIINDQVSGLIEYDETSDGTPLIIIDGKPFTWEEIGKMLMTYEGFQIKFQMYDITDDVE